MTIDGRIKDEKVQHDLNREQQLYQHYHEVKLLNMNS